MPEANGGPVPHAAAPASNRPAVLADGSYATQTALADTFAALPAQAGGASAYNLRALLLSGDFFLGGVIAGTLTKLVLRLRKLRGDGLQRLTARAMLAIASILRLGESPALQHPVDADSVERMVTCLKAWSLFVVLPWQPCCWPLLRNSEQVLGEGDKEMEAVWLEACRNSFSTMIHEKQARDAAELKQTVRPSMCSSSLCVLSMLLLNLLYQNRRRSRRRSRMSR